MVIVDYMLSVGFTLTRQADHFNATSVSKDQDTDIITAGLRAIPKVGDVISSVFSQVADPFKDSESASVKAAVAFDGGLRLANTPFPTLPAGALLAVSRVHESHVRSFHRLQQSTSKTPLNTCILRPSVFLNQAGEGGMP
jgi:hypothetical protein